VFAGESVLIFGDASKSAASILLTSTYFEGICLANGKVKRGYSHLARLQSDCCWPGRQSRWISNHALTMVSPLFAVLSFDESEVESCKPRDRNEVPADPGERVAPAYFLRCQAIPPRARQIGRFRSI
jgi:hypothetical protein